MKLLSIILRLVAIAGAAFCIYAWVDTKGKTSESMEHMKDVQGETLQARTAQIPSILASKAKTESDLKKTEQNLRDTKAELEERESDLRAERDRVMQATEEILAKNNEIKSLNTKVSGLESNIADSDAQITSLKSEIVKIKADTEPLIADLNSQIAQLETSLSNKDAEVAEAVAQAEKDLMAKLEANATIDPNTGEKVLFAKDKEPAYVPTDEIVAILKVDEENNMFVINKGSNSHFAQNQKFDMKLDGKFIAQLSISVVNNNMAVCAVVDKNLGIPESVLVGDLYELSPVAVVEEVAEETEE